MPNPATRTDLKDTDPNDKIRRTIKSSSCASSDESWHRHYAIIGLFWKRWCEPVSDRPGIFLLVIGSQRSATSPWNSLQVAWVLSSSFRTFFFSFSLALSIVLQGFTIQSSLDFHWPLRYQLHQFPLNVKCGRPFSLQCSSLAEHIF